MNIKTFVSGAAFSTILLASITSTVVAQDTSSKAAGTLHTDTATTNAGTNADLIASMRSEITNLKTIVADLAAQNDRLSGLVEKLIAQNLPADAEAPCAERQQALTSKLDQLKSLGYKDNHPDMINVTRQMDTVASECQAPTTAG